MRRRTCAPSESPISVSSAAACTTVPRISGRSGMAGTGERGCEGIPRGWGGWRSRSALLAGPALELVVGRGRRVAPASGVGLAGALLGVDPRLDAGALRVPAAASELEPAVAGPGVGLAAGTDVPLALDGRLELRR